MLTVIIHAKIKPHLLSEFIEVAKKLTADTLGRRKGCISYSFNQRQDKPEEFVIYEQWESQETLDAHIEKLKDLLGPEKEGELLPEKLLNFYESAEPILYNQI
ncbi:putative quinol monooxygenase [Vibrio marisflavi]|uniref:ABM domain-containing protein n=1 Tax=Vibrio marisflavi CECT 7928 TaxID=634439 RepID=A0ABM9A212_9VIBR|nr:antibiotic biosynthesis monooxygenase [Vibrio marisflavi]CAH0537780.1 hypothetical protein VMF7928_01333 [Vibrio marisflavi CECT 7928]